MTKYKVILFGNYDIKKIEIEKETKKSYWVKGIRSAKTSEYSALFDSFDEAKQFTIKRIENKYLVSKKRTEDLLELFTDVIKREDNQ